MLFPDWFKVLNTRKINSTFDVKQKPCDMFCQSRTRGLGEHSFIHQTQRVEVCHQVANVELTISTV